MSYEVEGFLDKNRDTLQEELMDLLYDSKNPFIVVVFGELKSERDRARLDEGSGGTMKGFNALPYLPNAN